MSRIPFDDLADIDIMHLHHVMSIFYREPNAIAPGSFFTKLLEAWGVADQVNSARLAAAFPTYGRIIDSIQIEMIEGNSGFYDEQFARLTR